MDFYLNHWWYAFAFIILVTNFLNLFGISNNGSKSDVISFWGALVTWIALIISFIFTGWIGGIALLIAYFLIIGPIGQRISFMVYKLSHPSAKYLTYKLFKIRDEFIQTKQSTMVYHKKLDAYIEAIKTNENAIRFLKDINLDINKINDIRFSLMASGAGVFVAYCVVRSPELVLEYIEMEKKGLSEREIGYEFIRGLEGVH